jgi:hypothetical protein
MAERNSTSKRTTRERCLSAWCIYQEREQLGDDEEKKKSGEIGDALSRLLPRHLI